MQSATFYIRERKRNCKVIQEPWVILHKADRSVKRKMSFSDYERLFFKDFSLQNRMLLHLFNHVESEPKDMTIEKHPHEPVKKGLFGKLRSIKVTGIDTKRSFKPEKNGLYHHFYFYLSEKPSERWRRIFTRVCQDRKARQEKFRYTWLEDGHIVIRCPIKELRVGYLNEIRGTVKKTNQIYRAKFRGMMTQGEQAGVDKDSLEKIAGHIFGVPASG